MIERRLEPEVMDTLDEAHAYAAMDHSGPNAAFVERLIELGAHGRMLDIGTGPGQIPLQVCDRIDDARITAIDLAVAMLDIARSLRDASPHRQRIALERADAKGLEFDDARFDAVFSNTILHHIPDPTPFLREAHRVLRPGGALLIRDLFRPDSQAALDALVDRYAGDDSKAQQALFRDSLHAALTPGELRSVADAAGLSHAEIVIDSDRHLSLQLRAVKSGR